MPVVEEMAVAFTTEGEADIEHTLHALTEAVEHLGESLHHVKPHADSAVTSLQHVAEQAAHGRHVVGEGLEEMGVFTEQIAKRVEHVGVTMAFVFASMASGGEAGLARLLHAGASLAFMFGTIPGVVATASLAIGEYLYHALHKSAEMAEEAKKKWEAYVDSLGESKNLDNIQRGIKALETGNKFLTLDEKKKGSTMFGVLEELVKSKGGLAGLDKEIREADEKLAKALEADTGRFERLTQQRVGMGTGLAKAPESLGPYYVDRGAVAMGADSPEVQAARKEVDELEKLRKNFTKKIEELKKEEEPAKEREAQDAEFNLRMAALKVQHDQESVVREHYNKQDSANYIVSQQNQEASNKQFRDRQITALDERLKIIFRRQREDRNVEDRNATEVVEIEKQKQGVLLEYERQRYATQESYAKLRLEQIQKQGKAATDSVHAQVLNNSLTEVEGAEQNLRIARWELDESKKIENLQASAREEVVAKVTAAEKAVATSHLAEIQKAQKAESDAVTASVLNRTRTRIEGDKEQLRIDQEALARAKEIPNLQAAEYEGMVAKVNAATTKLATDQYQNVMSVYDEQIRGVEHAETLGTMAAAEAIAERHRLALAAAEELVRIANLTEEQIRAGKKHFTDEDFKEDKRLSELRKTQSSQMSSLIGSSMKAALDASFAGGANPASAFGKALVAGLGDILSEQGSLYLKYGLIMQSLTPLLGDPFTAGPAGIAIGIALMALGSALHASASAHSAGGGARGTTNAVGGSYASSLPQIGMISPINNVARGMGNAGMIVPAQSITVNATIIGKDDPSAQRQLLEMIARADRRGTTRG